MTSVQSLLDEVRTDLTASGRAEVLRAWDLGRVVGVVRSEPYTRYGRHWVGDLDRVATRAEVLASLADCQGRVTLRSWGGGTCHAYGRVLLTLAH